MKPGGVRVPKPLGFEAGGTVLESRPLALVLGGSYALVMAVYLLSADGRFDFSGHVIGRDFINPWTAGALPARGDDLASIFDHVTWRTAQEALFGRALPAHNRSYPPTVLFVAGAVGWLPYVPAFALWSLATVGAYLFACRLLLPSASRLALLLAPATFASCFFGQTGCLVAALLIGGLGWLDRKPVLAGLLLGLASIKPHLGLLVPLALLAARAWRPMVSAALTVIAMAGLSAWTFGWRTWEAWFELTVPFQTRILEQGTGLFTLMMPSAFMSARLLGLAPEHAYLVQLPFTLLAAAAVWWAFQGLFRGRTPMLPAFAVLLLATSVATPYVYSYDLTLIGPALLIGLSSGRYHGSRAGETLVWRLAWLLPLLVIPLNGAGLPIGPVILSGALGLAALRSAAPARACPAPP